MGKLAVIEAKGTERLKRGFAKMVKGGVIMDVTNAEQARIAEEAGAVSVMALHRVPADIRKAGGVARMAPIEKIREILDAVTIPVMAKVRIGHVAEVLTPSDPYFHIDKREFNVPFVCGNRNLGEAVRRIWEGAAMMRTKGEAGTGNIVEAVRHVRLLKDNIALLQRMTDEQIYGVAEKFAEPYLRLAFEVREISGLPRQVLENEPVYGHYTYREIVEGLHRVLLEIKKLGRLPVVNFAAGGVATPADAALMMTMGMDGVFVGSGIFKSSNPPKMARAIVEAVNHWDEPDVLAEISRGIGEPMHGQDIGELQVRLEERGV